MKIPFLVIGGGLSGLAAAIRAARFIPDVLLVEQHSRLGGLNSYFFRNKKLVETGLHAITNYAAPGEKTAPLNRLFRQLKLRREDFSFCEQLASEICFVDQATIRFSNNIELLIAQIEEKFPANLGNFIALLGFIKQYDAFAAKPFISAKKYLQTRLTDSLLIDMLLCPLMYYGSSLEDDMDLSQFVIMFRAIFLEGMFRPAKTIKDFLSQLETHLLSFGAEVRLQTKVKELAVASNSTVRVILANGDELEAGFVLSTIGYRETLDLIAGKKPAVLPEEGPRLGFVETILQLSPQRTTSLPTAKTIVFYNCRKDFAYRVPQDTFDPQSGVICFPGNFRNLPQRETVEIRSTHLANHDLWQALYADYGKYSDEKKRVILNSRQQLEAIIGSFDNNIIFTDMFTPITIKRYTGKRDGAIYGSPNKIKDGYIGYPNLCLAGTDQGFLGIVGAMLSGVSITNQHFLSRL